MRDCRYHLTPCLSRRTPGRILTLRLYPFDSWPPSRQCLRWSPRKSPRILSCRSRLSTISPRSKAFLRNIHKCARWPLLLIAHSTPIRVNMHAHTHMSNFFCSLTAYLISSPLDFFSPRISFLFPWRACNNFFERRKIWANRKTKAEKIGMGKARKEREICKKTFSTLSIRLSL